MKLSASLSRFAVMLCCATALHAAEPATKSNGYTVMVEIKTNETGETESVSLLESEDVSADEVLSKMALAMALKTKVPPRMKDGKPVKTTVRAPFFFPIENDEGEAADKVQKPRVKEGAVYPVYPVALREQGVVGGAILELVIDTQGKLTRLTTLRASHPEFEAAATECLRKWTFAPALQNGQPVESRTRFAFTFDTEQEMADLKWRIAPRPRLGSLIVIRPDNPIPDAPAEPAAAEAPAATEPAGAAK
jgi:TonB family protein